jgi:hypothetical protein
MIVLPLGHDLENGCLTCSEAPSPQGLESRPAASIVACMRRLADRWGQPGGSRDYRELESSINRSFDRIQGGVNCFLDSK